MNTLKNTVVIFLMLLLFFIKRKVEAILGGNLAMSGWFKYQVSLQRNGYHICGGTIIGDRHVLTAAHCLVDSDMKFFGGTYTVFANEVDLNNVTWSAIKVEVEKFYIPTDYRPDLVMTIPGHISTGDIAVLKLETELGLDQNLLIAKVDLPQQGTTLDRVKAVVSGFGYDYIGPIDDTPESEIIVTSSNVLRYAMAYVMSNEKCQELYGPISISAQHLCAQVEQRGVGFDEGTCGGDSGGPLVHQNRVIGVVSTKPHSCAEDQKPGIYTRVLSYLEFIKTAMADVESPISYVPTGELTAVNIQHLKTLF